jgi:hypothetical protein
MERNHWFGCSNVGARSALIDLGFHLPSQSGQIAKPLDRPILREATPTQTNRSISKLYGRHARRFAVLEADQAPKHAARPSTKKQSANANPLQQV